MRESLKWIVIYIWYHLGLNSVLHFGQTYVFDTIITYKTINKTNTGTAIKYQGTSKWLPNQFTWQDESIRVEISKNKEINTFFIISPSYLLKQPNNKLIGEKYGTIYEPKYENFEPLIGEVEFKDVTFKYNNKTMLSPRFEKSLEKQKLLNSQQHLK